jgi:hypothetical protein
LELDGIEWTRSCFSSKKTKGNVRWQIRDHTVIRGIEGIFSKISVGHWYGPFYEKHHCNAYHQKSDTTRQPTGTQG